MDATTALNLLTKRSEAHAKDARESRERLTQALVEGGYSLAHLMDEVLKEESLNAPWRELMKRIEHHGVREGLDRARQAATETLTAYGIALSTSMVTNAERLYEQEGQRRFLSATNGMDIDDEAPAAEEAAPQPEAQPAPAATQKLTPAQRRTLEAVRDREVTLHENRGRWSVLVASGEKPRLDMVNWVIEKGWAVRNTRHSLYQGQRVHLTPAGTALLAS